MTEVRASGRLRVSRSSGEYASSSKCLCYLHASDLAVLGLTIDDLVEVKSDSGRSVLARVGPSQAEPAEPGHVYLDRFLRQAVKARVGDVVFVGQCKGVPVQKVALRPSIDVFEAHGLDHHLSRTLVENRTPVSVGSVLYVTFPDSVAGTTYKVSEIVGGPGVVTDETDLRLEYVENLQTDALAEVTFDDVGGMGRQLDLVRELVQLPLQVPAAYRQLGINAPRGIILHGPPGVGKTHLGRALANEVNARFYYINGPEVVGMMYGETETNLRRIFAEATHHAPSVILIDELDALAPRRGESGAQSDTRMVTQLLSLMDGLNRVDGVIVIGTTNRLDAIDVAMRRPGRFDRELFVGPPDAVGRLQILEIHSREMPLSDDAHDFLPELARRTPGFVGADLMEVCREAGLTRLRQGAEHAVQREHGLMVAAEELIVTRADFEEAITRIQPSAIREVMVTVPDVTWADIGGLDQVKRQLRRIVELPLERPEQLRAMKLTPPSGVLLFGPSGCGKTLLAKAIANECGVNFIAIEGPEIFSKWLGDSEEMIRRVFRLARQLAPSMIFFDQLDAIAALRGGDAGSKTTERVVNQLLVELDGLEALDSVIVLGATNRPELVDPSVLRPGRLGTHIYVPQPDEQARREIVGIQFAQVQIDEDLSPESAQELIAAHTVGCSGAQVRAVCDAIKLLAVESVGPRDAPRLTLEHVQQVLLDPVGATPATIPRGSLQ